MERCIHLLTFTGDRRTAYRRICDASAAAVRHVQCCRGCLAQLERVTLDEIALLRAQIAGDAEEEEHLYEIYRRALTNGSEAMVLQAKIQYYWWRWRTTLAEPTPVT